MLKRKKHNKRERVRESLINNPVVDFSGERGGDRCACLDMNYVVVDCQPVFKIHSSY